MIASIITYLGWISENMPEFVSVFLIAIGLTIGAFLLRRLTTVEKAAEKHLTESGN